MTWQLRRGLPKHFALSFGDADPASNRTLNEYEELLFLNSTPDKLVAIRKTELQGELYDTALIGNQRVSFPRPFVFSLKPTKKHPNVEYAKKLGRLLCLYDNAGEHFLPGQDTVGSPVTRHLAQSRVLLFLFDPIQDPRFRKVCMGQSDDPQFASFARTSRQELIFHEAADRIRRHTGIAQIAKHQRPLIVIVTKFDAWSHLLPALKLRSPVASDERNRCAVDVTYVGEVSSQLRSLLWKHSPEIVSAVESFAETVLYIPVSATGGKPEKDEKTGMLGIRPCNIHPLWVEVPLLYALCRWQQGMIPFLAHPDPPHP